MPLTPENIQTLARLAHLRLSDEETANMQQYLHSFFSSVVAPMQAVDTAGVTPLAHPVEIFQDVTLRLREDVVSEPDQREANQRSAPQVDDGLYLVPKVIE